MKKQHGFTLIEILVALVILAIVSSITILGLRTAVHTQETVNNLAKRLANVQEAILIMERDSVQMVNRPVIDRNGSLLPAFLVSYQNNQLGVEFTHTGFVNPGALQNRTTLQRVQYIWDGQSLFRNTWEVLDRVESSTPHTQLLLSGVSAFRIRLMDDAHQFALPSQPFRPQLTLPLAIEWNLEVNDIGSITRVIPIL